MNRSCQGASTYAQHAFYYRHDRSWFTGTCEQERFNGNTENLKILSQILHPRLAPSCFPYQIQRRLSPSSLCFFTVLKKVDPRVLSDL
jgi:hypothetical protein